MIHYVHLFQKPMLANLPGSGVQSGFIRRLPAYGYKHKIAAVGGFDTCAFNLAINAKNAEKWLNQYLGNRIAIIADNPVEPIWEGLVNRIKWQIGGLTLTASLDKLANRITINWANVTTAASNGPVNDTDSQAVYGIKQDSIDGRVQYTGTGSTLPTALLNNAIAQRAWPRISTAFSSGGGKQSLLSVEGVGFYHTLKWEDWAFASNSAVSASQAISDVISGLANGTTFFDNADLTAIATNTAFNQNKLSRTGQTAWEFMQAIQEAGDGSTGNFWVMGVEPTRFGTMPVTTNSLRRFYYRQANTNIEYTTRLSDGGRIRNASGMLVSPWWVRPDRGIRVNDVLVGWNGFGDNPRESYIESITYDADAQKISWQTSDSIEEEGAFQLRQYFKTHGSRFGEAVRQVG